MPRPPTKKQIAEFREEAISILREFGFKESPKGIRQYEVMTDTAGLLSVSIMENFLACVFDDPQLAAANNVGSNLNTHSGKWNWHGGIMELKWFKAVVDQLFGETLVPNNDLKLVPLH